MLVYVWLKTVITLRGCRGERLVIAIAKYTETAMARLAVATAATLRTTKPSFYFSTQFIVYVIWV